MVIELSGVQFGLKSYMHDFKIERARSTSLIWNHKYDFRPKLYDPKFNYHFIRSILKSYSLIAWIQELQLQNLPNDDFLSFTLLQCYLLG